VRLLDKNLDELGVFLGKLSHGLVLVLQGAGLKRDQEAVKLLFLVSFTVLLDHNGVGKMLQELSLEDLKVFVLGIGSEVSK